MSKPTPWFYSWRSGEYDDAELEDAMDFRLIYEGPLKASNNTSRRVPEKHAIRKTLHPQLSDLWTRHPWLNYMRTKPDRDSTGEWADPRLNPQSMNFTALDVVANRFQRCGYRFLPLVGEAFSLVCGLDITFLRRENPGALITSGGDVDNRIKTLLDALTVPKTCDQLPGDAKPEPGEDPFFCLLEDDHLVTRLNVTTDRLLRPCREGEGEDDVLLVIRVKVKATRTTWGNMGVSV